MLKRRIDKLEQSVIKTGDPQPCRIEICKVGETSEQAKARLGIPEHEHVIIIGVISGGASWDVASPRYINHLDYLERSSKLAEFQKNNNLK